MKFFGRFASILLGLCYSGLVLAQSGQRAPVPVYVAEVALSEFVDDVEALGTLQANENVALASTVTELVTAVNFDDGQRVLKGDVLVEMDASEELAELAEEQSRVDEARRQVNRFEPLIGRGAAAEATLDEQRRELKTAQARVQAIESRIALRKIVAPFDGVVGLRNISVGALAQPGTVITTIDDDSIMKLDFSVPELFLSTLQPGIKIQARASAFADQVYEGTVASVDSRVDPVTRSIVVRALLDNQQRTLKPGLLMQVVLQKNPRTVIVIPEEAIIPDGEQSFVLVAVSDGEQHVAERRAVELGARRQGEVEIVTGLEIGESVVTHGTLRARPGSALDVRAVEKGDATLIELIGQKSSSAVEESP